MKYRIGVAGILALGLAVSAVADSAVPPDVQQWIQARYPSSARKRAALQQLAGDVAALFSGQPTRETAFRVLTSARCIHAMIPDIHEAREATDELHARLLSVPEFKRGAERARGQNEFKLSLPEAGAKKAPVTDCRFDPAQLAD